MKKIVEKARLILRNVYAALGATAMPFLIHAAYGMREPDLSSYRIPLQGRVVSEETGDPVAGISVTYDRYATADTDGDGRFLIYVPEENFYPISFFDADGFENGGFFLHKNLSIARHEVEGSLEISLYRERQVAVIRGTVRSKETLKPIPGIRVSIQDGDSVESGHTPFYSGFEGLSDNEGQFSIQAPERDIYTIRFFDDNGLFERKEIHIGSDEIKGPLEVDLEQRTEEYGA
jgi:hypothetical protein